MPATVKEIEDALFEWAPRSLAEEWDNVGLQCGDPDQGVKTVVITLDTTPSSLAFALKRGADLVISHHPLIFKPLSCLNLKDYTARLLAGFLRHDISVISMHTNLDSCTGGVNDKLCELLEVINTSPLLPSLANPKAGLGRIGTLKSPMRQTEFLEHVRKSLKLQCLSFAGESKRPIHNVAVCSGSGSSLFDAAFAARVQAYVTAELKHSICRKAETENMLLVDAGHFETEHPVVTSVCEFLTDRDKGEGWNLNIEIFSQEASPISYWPRDHEK